MVAIQRVEYSAEGQILAPRKELMTLRRELNGKPTIRSDHWHRHTLAAESKGRFDRSLEELKAELQRAGAEVFKIHRSGPTVVDVFYLIEDSARTAKVLRQIAAGKRPPELSLGDLTPCR